MKRTTKLAQVHGVKAWTMMAPLYRRYLNSMKNGPFGPLINVYAVCSLRLTSLPGNALVATPSR